MFLISETKKLLSLASGWNIDSKPQSEYYLPFESSTISRIGGLEAKDKKAPEKGAFKVEVVGLDTER